MHSDELARKIEELFRDLDMVVYKLELPRPAEAEGWQKERTQLRTELEALRDRLQDITLYDL